MNAMEDDSRTPAMTDVAETIGKLDKDLAAQKLGGEQKMHLQAEYKALFHTLAVDQMALGNNGSMGVESFRAIDRMRERLEERFERDPRAKGKLETSLLSFLKIEPSSLASLTSSASFLSRSKLPAPVLDPILSFSDSDFGFPIPPYHSLERLAFPLKTVSPFFFFLPQLKQLKQNNKNSSRHPPTSCQFQGC